MKTLLTICLVLVTSSSIQAANRYWDLNGATAGAGGPIATGTWDAATTNWTTESTGGSVTSAWVAGDTAIFAAGSDATGTYTVTLDATQDTSGISLEEGNVTVSGGTALNLSGASAFNIASGSVLTLSSKVTGVGPTTVQGGGVLLLNSTASTNTGAIGVTGGSTLRVVSSGAIGGTGVGAGNITLDNGTFQNDVAAGAVTFLTGNRGIVIGAGGGTINVPGAAIQIYTSGSITGAGNTLTKSGSGTFRNTTPTAVTFSKLVVTGGLYQSDADTGYGAAPASPLADAITLDGGGLGISAGVTFVTNRGITLGAAGGRFDGTSSANVNGIITGVGSLTKTGSGTYSLNNSGNNYQGSTTFVAGTIGLDADGKLGNGAGTLDFQGGNLSTTANRGTTTNNLANPISISANTQWSSAPASGTNNLVFTTNSLVGSAGTLTLRNTGATGSTFDVRLNGADFSFGRPIVIGQTGDLGAVQLSLFNTATTGTTGTQTFNGIVSGTGSMRRSATTGGTGGTTILTGANTYSGNTLLNDGFIGFGSDSVGAITSGPIGTGTLIVGASTTGVFASGGPRVVANPITLNANTSITGSNQLEMSGTVALGSTTRTLTVANSADTKLSGVISGGGGLTKAGSGVLVLSNANTYSGGTTVSAGTLRVANSSGSATGSGAVVVNGGGTLAGTGAVDGPVTINSGGAIAPGNTPGVLNVGAITFNAGSTFQYEVDSNAAPAASADLINANGNLTIAAAGALLNVSYAGTNLLSKLTLISYAGTWDGNVFDTFADDSIVTLGGNQYVINYNDVSGGLNFGGGIYGDGVNPHFLTLTAVPEAGAFISGCLVCCVVGIGVLRRKLVQKKALNAASNAALP